MSNLNKCCEIVNDFFDDQDIWDDSESTPTFVCAQQMYMYAMSHFMGKDELCKEMLECRNPFEFINKKFRLEPYTE